MCLRIIFIDKGIKCCTIESMSEIFTLIFMHRLVEDFDGWED